MSDFTATIQLRADTAANWASSNPILKSNELGIETDSFTTSGGVRLYKCKLGDETTAWNSLPYANIGQFFAGGGGASVAWGGITGNISDQTDLQALIDSKLNITDYKPMLFFQWQAIGAADNTTYRFNALPAVPATQDVRHFQFDTARTFTMMALTVSQSINASNETVTVQLRNITQGTQQVIGTYTSDFGAARSKTFIFTPVGGFDVNTSDEYNWAIVTPAWVTNPGNYVGAGYVR